MRALQLASQHTESSLLAGRLGEKAQLYSGVQQTWRDRRHETLHQAVGAAEAAQDPSQRGLADPAVQEPYNKLQKVNAGAFSAHHATALLQSGLHGEAAASEDSA